VAGVGFDLMRDGSEANDLDGDCGFAELISGGIHCSAGLEFGKVYAAFEIGGYLFSKVKDTFDMYDRVSVNYQVGKRLMAHVGLRTFLMKAYYIEWGMGFQIGSIGTDKKN
jgi:hypothetical protein